MKFKTVGGFLPPPPEPFFLSSEKASRMAAREETVETGEMKRAFFPLLPLALFFSLSRRNGNG